MAGRSVKMKYVYCANFYLLKHFFYFFRFILQVAARWVENLLKKVKKNELKEEKIKIFVHRAFSIISVASGMKWQEIKITENNDKFAMWNGERDVNRVDNGKIIELRWNNQRVSALILCYLTYPFVSSWICNHSQMPRMAMADVSFSVLGSPSPSIIRLKTFFINHKFHWLYLWTVLSVFIICIVIINLYLSIFHPWCGVAVVTG